MRADLEVGHTGSHFFDDSHAFVSQYPSGGDGRNVTFQDMEIGSANRRRRYSDDGICRRLNERLRFFLQGAPAWPEIR